MLFERAVVFLGLASLEECLIVVKRLPKLRQAVSQKQLVLTWKVLR